MHDLFGEGFPSGQRDQTVNLTRKLRWFESTPLHHIYSKAANFASSWQAQAGSVAGIVQW